MARLRGEQALEKVRLREVTRARVALTSQGVAPGNEATLQQLTDETLRPRELTAPVPVEVLHKQPASPLQLDADKLLQALRTAGRGSAPDLSGSRYEHYRVLMEDEELWGLFAKVAQAFLRAQVPDTVASALRLGRMTAL